MIDRYSHRGSEDIGFYATVTDSYIFAAPEFKTEGLEVEAYHGRITGTVLTGLFTAGNSDTLLLPRGVSDRELESLEGLDTEVVDTSFNALGNLILCNDSGAVISEKISGLEERIGDALGVEVETGSVAGVNPGVAGVANGKGAVLHREASEEEAELVADILGVEVSVGSINQGSPFMGSGALANSKGALVGGNTTGPEIGRIDRTMY